MSEMVVGEGAEITGEPTRARPDPSGQASAIAYTLLKCHALPFMLKRLCVSYVPSYFFLFCFLCLVLPSW